MTTRTNLKIGDIIYMINPKLIKNDNAIRAEELYAVAIQISENISVFRFTEPGIATNNIFNFSLHRNYVDIDENNRIMNNGDTEAEFRLMR